MAGAVICAAALALTPAAASASTTLGSSLAFNGSGAGQPGCNPLCTIIPTAINGGNPVKSPITGVVVRWGASAADFSDPMMGPTTSTVRLRIVRSPAANQWTGAGTGSTQHTTAAFQNAFFDEKPGVPIAANDYIGVDTVRDTMTSATTLRVQAGSSFVHFLTPLQDNAPAQAAAPQSGFEAFVQATVEPDADNDRFGDETQDKCPGVGGPIDGCPISSSTSAAPGTAISKAKISQRHDSARFTFVSDRGDATFLCKLDRKRFKPCTSPKKYRHLRPRKHTFLVEASAAGVVDPTPAKRKFRIR